MPIKSRILDAHDARRQRDAFGQALRSHLSAGEHVREWVFGRTWSNELVRVGRGLLPKGGALGGAIYGLVLSRSQGRYIVLTNRRVLSLVGDANEVTLEWDESPASVIATTLRRVLIGSEFVVRRGGGHETRLHVDQPFRKQAKALAAAL